MASTSLTLLQFVALALPAVAILMQALMRYNENHGNDSSSKIEYYLIGFSFLTLVVSALFFGLSIYQTQLGNSTTTGLLLLMVSLTLLGASMWPALIRTITPPQYFGSMKEAIITGILKPLRSHLAVLFVALGVVFTFSLFISIPNVKLPLITALTLIFATITLITSVANNVSQLKENRKKTKEWESNLLELLDEWESYLRDISHEDLKRGHIELENRLKSFENRLAKVNEEQPDGVNQETRLNLSDIKQTTEYLHDKLKRIARWQAELEEKKSRIDEISFAQDESLDELMKERDRLEKLQSEIEENSEKEEIKDKIDYVRERIEELESERYYNMEELKEMKQDVAELEEILPEEIKEAESLFETLKNQINKLKETLD